MCFPELDFGILLAVALLLTNIGILLLIIQGCPGRLVIF